MLTFKVGSSLHKAKHLRTDPVWLKLLKSIRKIPLRARRLAELEVLCSYFFQTCAFSKAQVSVLNRSINESQGFVLLKLLYVSKLSSKQLVSTQFGHSNRGEYVFPSICSVMAGLTLITKLGVFPVQVFWFVDASSRAQELLILVYFPEPLLSLWS